MSYTKFGEYVRILRIKNHEVMGDMAKILNVKAPFLSAVENGKKNIPSEWEHIISEHYNLTVQEHKELSQAIEESKTQYKISTKKAGISQRKVAMQFARSFDEMDDDTAEKILTLLSKMGDEKNN